MANLSLQLLTPKGAVFEGQVASVKIPTVNGEAEVLPAHADYLAVLDVGILESPSIKQKWLIGGGTASVEKNHIAIVADSVLDVESEEARDLAKAYKSLESELSKGEELSESERRSLELKFKKALALSK